MTRIVPEMLSLQHTRLYGRDAEKSSMFNMTIEVKNVQIQIKNVENVRDNNKPEGQHPLTGQRAPPISGGT